MRELSRSHFEIINARRAKEFLVAGLAFAALGAVAPEPTIADDKPEKQKEFAIDNPDDPGHVGRGIVIENERLGFAIGLTYPGHKIVPTEYSPSKKSVFGAITVDGDGRIICGSIDASAIDNPKRQTFSSECSDSSSTIKNPFSFGYGFNCGIKKNKCTDGTYKSELSEACDGKMYALPKMTRKTPLNPADLEKSEEFGKRIDVNDKNDDNKEAGREKGPVSYRYTFKGGKSVMVRSYTFGWGIMSIDCFPDPDYGGPLKLSFSVLDQQLDLANQEVSK